MHYVSSSSIGRNFSGGGGSLDADAAITATGVVVGIPSVLWNLVGLLLYFWVALIAFMFVALCFILWGAKPFAPDDSKGKLINRVFQVLTVDAALISAILTGGFHAVNFRTLSIVCVSLLALATLFFIFVGALTVAKALKHLGIVAALLITTIVVPPPPGSREADREKNAAHLFVHVKNTQGKSVNGADVWLNVKIGSYSPDPDDPGEHKKTEINGTVHYKIEDPYVKTAVIQATFEQDGVRYKGREQRFLGPAEIDDVTVLICSPGEYCYPH